MKTVLWLDMIYHSKTKSSLFLIELLKEHYIVDVYYYDSRLAIVKNMQEILKEEYDYLVCWQVIPDDYVLAQLHYGIGIFFPMYDSVIGMADENWARVQDFMIINFSQELHRNLLRRGFCSKYIQYFPEIQKVQNWGEKDSLFFWQRVNEIDINMILSICSKMDLRKVHLHKALDPGYRFIQVNSKYSIDIEYSDWFENKDCMLNLIMQSSYYAAPRRYEGIGMSYLEAMALGRCVIAPDYSTMNEYIINGETGMLYNYENPSLLSVPDVRKIQKNVYEYMSEGYLKWNEKKHCIIEWMEKGPAELCARNSKNENFIVGNSGEKFKAYFKLLNIWLMIKNRGISIADWFLDAKIQTIMIYGGGEVASRLIEELEETSVRIIGIIDQNPYRVKSQIPTYGLSDSLPEVDMIVVTPFYSFSKIHKLLCKKTNSKMVSINEILGYLLNDI